MINLISCIPTSDLPALISGIPDTRENLSSILKKAAAAGVREIDYDPLNFYLAAVFNLRAVFKKHWPRQRLKQPAGSLIITNNTCAVWQRSYWLNMGMNKGREAEGSRGTFFLLPGRLSRERSIWWLVVGRWSCSVFSQDMGNKNGSRDRLHSFTISR